MYYAAQQIEIVIQFKNIAVNTQDRNLVRVPKDHSPVFMKKDNKDTTEEEFQGKYVDSDREQTQKKKKNPTSKIVMAVADTQYPVVKFTGKKIMKWCLDYSPIDQLAFDLCWTDNAVKPELLSRMQPHQKINHFPGMYVLSRKNNLGRNLMKLRKLQPDEYNFFPMTFVLPGDFNDLRIYHQNRKAGKAQTFIVKPEASCQGRGIYLTRNIDRIKSTDRCVVQRYLHKPFLIDGLKFDLRIYVLVTGTDPLRIFVFQEGLARFATEEYVAPRTDNLEDICMHLTNYAINKDNPNFVFNESAKEMDKGHKRSLTSVYQLLRSRGYDVDTLKRRIEDIFIKTLMSGQPVLHNMYRSCQPNNFANDMCFQVLGFDIIIDSKFNPILLEINYTPSFSTDTPLDSLIKKNVIRDTLRILNINEKNKAELKMRRDKEVNDRIVTGKRKKYTEDERYLLTRQAEIDRTTYENNNLGGFKRIYPVSEQQVKEYSRFLKHSQDIHDCVPNTPSAVLTAERIAQLQRQIKKISLATEDSSNNNEAALRKNQSLNIKPRDSNNASTYKKSGRGNNYNQTTTNGFSDIVKSIDGGNSSCSLDASQDFRNKIHRLQNAGNENSRSNRKSSKPNKKTVISRTHKSITSNETISQQVYLFSNQNLKNIAANPPSDETVVSRGIFTKKKPALLE